MTTGTSPGIIPETYFKPTDGGFLFETPSPWLFAPGRRYIVSEDQKRALLDIMRPRRPVLRIALISGVIIAFACGVSLLWWAFSPRENPNLLDLLGMAVAILVPLYAAALVGIRRHLRRVAPIVSTAVPTQARLTTGERYRSLGDAMSTKLLVVLGAVWTLSGVTSVISIVTRSSAQLQLGEPRLYMAVLQTVMSLSFALFAAYTLYRRLRRPR